MSRRVKTVERELEVKVPRDYSKFLDKYGTYQEDGEEVYGLSDDIKDISQIHCVIGATWMSRKQDRLDHRFIVVNDTGVEDEIVCLDSEDGKMYRISHVQGTTDQVAESFSKWFDKEILGGGE